MTSSQEKKKTLAREVSFRGIGLHSGKIVTMTLKPITTNAGIIFQRTDMPAGISSSILSTYSNLVNVDHSTNIGDHNGCTIRTVEHLLAVLHAFEIDNLLVQLDGPEVPIADGSSRPLVEVLEQAGVRELPYAKERMIVRKSVEYSEGDKYIRISPHRKLKISYLIDFPNHFIGRQTYSITVNKNNFKKKIAPARTFCLLHEVEFLKKNGLAKGGSLDNAVVVADDRILNGGLRFDDEFVRHKVLDVIGDLFLLGKPVQGHVEVHKGGHDLHTKLLQQILSRPDSYSITGEPLRDRRLAATVNRNTKQEKLGFFPVPTISL